MRPLGDLKGGGEVCCRSRVEYLLFTSTGFLASDPRLCDAKGVKAVTSLGMSLTVTGLPDFASGLREHYHHLLQTKWEGIKEAKLKPCHEYVTSHTCSMYCSH